MSNSTLEEEVASYLQSPVSGERLPIELALSVELSALLDKLAAERAVAKSALVEFFLFKQIRAEQARRLVDEPLEPIPSSFSNLDVARARKHAEAEIEHVKSQLESRGDKAARIARDLEAVLDGTDAPDLELDEVRRRTALDEARLELAVERRRGPEGEG